MAPFIRDRRDDFIVLILAKDEVEIIGDSLTDLIQAGIPPRCIHVVADQCTDRTAEVASAHGVTVFARNGTGKIGKGPALAWWIQQTRLRLDRNSKILILDADSRVTPSALNVFTNDSLFEDRVYQMFVQPIVEKKTTINLLAALSEVSEQRIHDDIARRVGFSTRLRGTGMVFPLRILEQFSHQLKTHVEDIELSLLLTANRIRIESIPGAVILDPKPSQTQGAIHQRARWLRGQFDVVRRHHQDLLKLIMMGPAAWGILKATLWKPKALLLPIQMALVLLIWALSLQVESSLLLLGSLFILNTMLIIDLCSLLYGIRFVENRRETVIALLASPLYILLWMHSFSLVMANRNDWLRSRFPARPSPVSYAPSPE